jgi:site-specific DNA recombinase
VISFQAKGPTFRRKIASSSRVKCLRALPRFIPRRRRIWIWVATVCGSKHLRPSESRICSRRSSPKLLRSARLLLAGLVFDESGERLTPTHAVKKGTRYRYYVSRSLIIGAAKDHSKGWRIPAGNLEGLVIDRLRAHLADEGAMLSAISDAEDNGAEQKRLIARGRQISGEFPTLTPNATRAILMKLVSRIDIRVEHIEIRVYRRRLHDLIKARSLEPFLAAPARASHPGDTLKLKVKARLQRVGREMKLVVHNAEDRAAADPGLLRIVARAHDFQERLIQDPDLTVPAIVSRERLTIGYLSRLLRLPSLAPDIVTAIINGKHPLELSAKRLMRLVLKLPTDWPAQRKLLGFQEA